MLKFTQVHSAQNICSRRWILAS